MWDDVTISVKKNIAAKDNEGSGDTIVVIPLVLANTEFVNSFFVAIVNDTVTARLFRGREYDEFPFLTDPQTTTANKIAAQIMVLDKIAFGYEKFRITDRRLFNYSNQPLFPAGIFLHVKETQNTTGRSNARDDPFGDPGCYPVDIMWDPDGDEDICDCSGNEVYSHTIWVGDDCRVGGGSSNGNGNGIGTNGQGNGDSFGWGGNTGNGGVDIVNDPLPPPTNPVDAANSFGWMPIKQALAPEPVDTILAKQSAAINTVTDSLFQIANQPSVNKEYGFIIVRKNGIIYHKNIRGGINQYFTPFEYSLDAGEELIGELHLHQSGTPNPKDRPSFSGDDINVLRKFKTKHQYVMFVDCGNVRYALVIEDVAKATTFFANKKPFQLKDGAAQALSDPQAYSNWQQATETAILNLLNPSSTTGIGFYKSNNTTKTQYTKLN